MLDRDLIKIMKNKKGTNSFDTMVLLVILIFLAYLVFIMLSNKSDSYKLVSVEKTPIYSLKDNTGVSGEMLLGTGTIDSEIYYYYVIKTESGGFQQKSVESSNSTIFYLEEGEPYIETFVKEYDFNLFNFFASESHSYNIYLPEGSVIIDEYEVDSED